MWYTLPGISRARCCQTSDGWEVHGILQHPSSWWAKEMSSRLWSQWAVWLVELNPTTRPNQGGKVWRCEAESQQTFFTFYISSDFLQVPSKFNSKLISREFTRREDIKIARWTRYSRGLSTYFKAADLRKGEEASPTCTYDPFTSWIVFMLYCTYVLLSAHRAYVLFTLSFPIEI